MSSMIGRIVLLVSDQPASRAIARALVARGIVVSGIIIQTSAPRMKHWKHTMREALGDDLYYRIVSLRWPANMRQLFWAERWLQRNAQRTLAEFLGDRPQAFPGTTVLVTQNVNSDEAYQFLQRHAPDLLVVYATGLLRKRMMEAAPLGAVNAHTAILPDYRGAWAEFWQLYDRAYDKTGITIHCIDEGVDTGDILHRQRVPVTEETDPWMLRALNTIQIVRDYPMVVQQLLTDGIVRRPQSASSTPCFRAKDLTDAHKRVLLERLKVLRPASNDWVRVRSPSSAAPAGPALNDSKILSG